MRELERRHNTHRNTTENTIYFTLLALVFVLVSPTTVAAQAWIVGFAVARLGYTYSYLAGKDDVRGLFMSLSLLAVRHSQLSCDELGRLKITVPVDCSSDNFSYGKIAGREGPVMLRIVGRLS